MAKVLKLSSNEAYQLKLSLDGIKPAVWRRFVVSADIKLSDLHKVIQTVMGWTNTHLHQFMKDGTIYASREEDSADDDVDYSKVRLSRIINSEKDSFTYEYDFGDGWVHLIVLEKIIPDANNIRHPVCIDGKRNVPPEDCGGVPGYMHIMKILKNPAHEEYEETMEWLGGYDPEEFDLEIVNDLLEEKDYGCVSFDD